MTERDIQKHIKANRKYWKAFIPNLYWNDLWEADLIEITKQWEVIEYEIKCSRQDYFADFKKHEKHNFLQNAFDFTMIPNYFYFVCPEGLIEENETPTDYAGLIYIVETKYNLQKKLRIIHKAPLLHNERVDYDKWRDMFIRIANKIPI